MSKFHGVYSDTPKNISEFELIIFGNNIRFSPLLLLVFYISPHDFNIFLDGVIKYNSLLNVKISWCVFGHTMNQY